MEAQFKIAMIASECVPFAKTGGLADTIRDAAGNIVFDSGNILESEAIARGIYADGRSDVYALGATMFHLLANPDPDQVMRYWTDQRMDQADPMPVRVTRSP